jgi:benzodiazapine receptor
MGARLRNGERASPAWPVKGPLRQALAFAAIFSVVFMAAALGGLATASSVGAWYAGLAKPSWTPPPWLFGPAWMFLYTTMALAAWLVWRRPGRGWALRWFAVQLALNAAWSPVFFGLRQPGWGFGVIVLLWLAIGGTLVAFWRVTRVAGSLFIPYWLWVTFAMALNFTVWQLNR